MTSTTRVAMFVVLIAVFAPFHADAGEIWAFRFDSLSNPISTSWHDDLIFHNTTAGDAVVRLLGVSNGAIRSDDLMEISVPAGRTVSMWNFWGVWWPDTFPGFWAVHAEVPDGVLVASRGEAHSECPSPCGRPTNPDPDLGTFAMPVFRALVQSGVPQLHMGADLGAETARLNVGIYNAGAAIGTATITVYPACDDTPLEVRTVRILPNTASQAGGFGSAKPSCGVPERGQNPWLRYAVVVVDQPSVSYVINVADDLPFWPKIPFGAAIGF